jgi:hypothetical protein
MAVLFNLLTYGVLHHPEGKFETISTRAEFIGQFIFTGAALAVWV